MEIPATGGQPRISVVIVTYNFEKFLHECIDSILAQTLRPCEIVIYDDCSTDGSWEIISAYSREYPDLFVVHRQAENVGMHVNANTALQRACGELVSVLDGDDRWAPRKLELEWAAMCRNPEAGMAYSNVHCIDAEGRQTAIWYDGKGPEPPSGDVFVEVFSKRFFPGIRSIFRNPLVYRSALEEMDYHDENVELYIDWDLKLRLSAAYPIAYSGAALVDYRIHSGGIHNQPVDTHLRDLETIYRKNLPLLENRTPAEQARVEAELESLAAEYGGSLPIRPVAHSRPEAPEFRRPRPNAAANPGGLGENLVFLVSLPRSGSTLLQRVLANHPDVHTTAEPWIMLHPLYALKRKGIETEYESDLARRALDDFLATMPGGDETYIEALRAMASVLYGKALQSSGKSVFLDKTPRYFYILPELVRVFPKARFVLLSRNPAAVLSSILRTWLGDDLQALQQHQHYVDLVRGPALLSEGMGVLGDAAINVHYEDLVNNPAATVRRICSHVGIAFQPAMLDYGQAPVPGGSFGDPCGVHRHNTVVGDYLDTWRTHLAHGDFRDFSVRYIDSLGEAVIETLGYSGDAIRRAICGEQVADSDIRTGAVAAEKPVASGVAGGGRNDAVAGLNAEGEQAFNAGDVEQAIALFRRAQELAPEDIEVLNNLVVAHWQNEDLVNTLDSLAEALDRDPGNRDVVVNGGQILVALEKQDEARILYSSYLEKNPQDAEVTRLLSAIDGADVDAGSGAVAARFVDYSAGGEAPRISVVIPSFNQGEFLEETICSVLDQGYPNLELIVMDGGSTDQSVDIIKRYAAQISYWTSSPDRGQYWAVEAGLQRSTGDIMTWINSDDKLHPGSLNAVASIFSGLEEVDWVTGTPNIMNENGELAWVCSSPPVFSREYYLEKRYDYPNYIQQEGTFWRRSLWEKAGGRLKTSLKMAGDLELWMRFFRHARLYTTDMLLGCFRQHGGQKTAGGLKLYRTEALKELGRELTRFRKSGQALPETAPVIMIADQARSLQKAAGRKSEIGQFPAGGNDILVTAIVSTYNSERYIRGCLEDLEAQTIADRLEIVVVDSGSAQNEGAIVEVFQQRYANIVYIRTEERETIYAAWNRGVAAARGKYLTNANTDDRHHPAAFERMVSELEAGPDIALVYADSAVTGEENAAFGDASIEAYFRWPEFNARRLFSDCYIGPQPMWRRSLHEKYGLFDAQMKVAGDYEFWLRAAVGETFKHIPEVLGLYLKSPDSVQHSLPENTVLETELARTRHWPVEWGEQPERGKSYLVSADESGVGDKQQAASAPLVSIIMPTKNRLELLGRALDSVLAQTYRNWELIVVNDGGDDVAPVIDSRSSRGSVRCIRLEQSGGQAAARNLALQAAQGEIICYLDDDDIYLDCHLATVVAALSQERRPFVYTDAVLVQERYNNGHPVEEGERSNLYAHDDYSRARLLVANYIAINTWAHWKSCLDQVGLFDVSLNCYEDWEFLLRFSARYEFFHIRQTTVEVRVRSDRVDNITRQRLADTASAYRKIYDMHADGLPADLRQARSRQLQALEHNAVDRLQMLADITAGDDGAPAEHRDDAATTAVQVLQEQFLRRAEASAATLPSVHLVMVVDEHAMAGIADTIDSLDRQIYTGWGLSIISTAPPPHRDFDSLPMLEWIQSDDVAQACAATLRNSACDWVGSVAPGDTLEPETLSTFVDYINSNPGWKFIYSDEDCVDAAAGRINHKFKPDSNPDYLCSSPYTGNLSLVHRTMLEQLNPDTGAVPAAVFYDLALKVLDRHGAAALGHIPTLLYHQLQANASREARDSWVKPLLEAWVARNRIDARVLPGAVAGTCMVDYRCSGSPAVCIAVYAGNDFAKLERTVTSLLQKTAYANCTVRLGVGAALVPLLEKYCSERLSVDPLDNNASRCSYFADLAQSVDADYMVFMDSGVVVLQDNWLERLLAQGQRADIGAVGIRLVSPQSRVAHAGLVTGMGSLGIGGCIGEGDTLEQAGYMQRAQLVQNLSAVSSACMLTRRSLFRSLHGFDADIDVQLYQDVDYCLRLSEAGKRIVWTPFVTMLISDDRLDTYSGDGGMQRVEQDARQLTSRWLEKLAADPAYNRNLTLRKTDFSLETGFKPAWDPAIRDLPRITGAGAGSYVPWAYRVAQPLAALSAAGKAVHANIPFTGENLEYMPSVVELQRAQPDVLLLHNTLHDHCLESLRQYRTMNDVFMVFSQDDLMFAVPPKSSCFKTGYKDIKKRLRSCLALMDRLIVTCEPLADELSGFINDIRVVPNRLDARLWGNLESRRGCGVKPRVGWAGAMQHHGDLEMLATVVSETADEVDWIFMGMCPEFLRPHVREVHEYVAFSAYPETLAKLNLDLAVAPLERNRFNRSKSNLRLLEYGAMGWPVIATDIEPYRDAPVCRVGNQASAWINAIREHINDLDASWKAGDTLRDWVRENYLLQGHLDDWLDALDPAADGHSRSRLQCKASEL